MAAPAASVPGSGVAGMTGITGATMEVPTGLSATMTPVLYSPSYTGAIQAAAPTAFADSSVLSTAGASPLAATETPWWQTPMAKQAAGQMLQQGQKKLGEGMQKPMPGAPALRLGGQQPQMNIVPADRLAWLRAFKLQG